MDGTIYSGATLFSFTKPFLATLDDLGIGHTFLTNNSSKSVRDYLAHLRSFGIEVSAEQVYTSTHATIAYLRAMLPLARRLFVLGTQSMADELSAAGYEVLKSMPGDRDGVPDALVVGFDTAMTYPRLCAAAWWASRGVPYVASHPDVYCPTDQPTVLVDCGAICAAIASSTGRQPDAVVGKPDPYMLHSLAKRLCLRPDELLMAGDRLQTDVAMARRAGAMGVLVLTGDSTAEQARLAAEAPDLTLPTLAELGAMLVQSRKRSVEPAEALPS
jgi:NagD protein